MIPGAHVSQNVAQGENLLLCGPDRRDQYPLGVEVALVSRHGQAQSTGLNSVADQLLHRLDLVLGGLAALALVSHDVVPDGGVSDQCSYVYSKALLVQGIHVLAGSLPGEVYRAKYFHWNRFHTGQELGDPFLCARPYRRQGQRAVSYHHRGRAVETGKAAHGVPGHLCVVVAVVVHEAGGHNQSVGIDDSGGRAT